MLSNYSRIKIFNGKVQELECYGKIDAKVVDLFMEGAKAAGCCGKGMVPSGGQPTTQRSSGEVQAAGITGLNQKLALLPPRLDSYDNMLRPLRIAWLPQ